MNGPVSHAARATVLGAALFLALPARSAAQSNPFYESAAPAPAASSISVPAPRLRGLIDAQRALRELLAEAVNRSETGGAGLAALLGISFAYGLLHALGPGHRKLALAAYFVSRPARPIDGVSAGLSVAFLHAASAVAAIYGLYYLLEHAVMTAFSSVSSFLELSSYAAIAAIGLILLVFSLRERLRPRKPPGADPPAAAGGAGRKGLAAIVVGSGIVPCPGTALVLVFCLSHGLPWTGVLAALAILLGMSTVTVGVSQAAILGKRGLLTASRMGSGLSGAVHHALEIGGAALILAFGLFMLSPYLAGALK